MKNKTLSVSNLKIWLANIVFKTDTKAGRLFDLLLLIFILSSIFIIVIDSIQYIHLKYNHLLNNIEYFFTLVFTLEYLTRILISKKPIKYILSFWGIIDLISIIPSYIGIFIEGTHYLMVIRVLRLLRIFRILKLVNYLKEAKMLVNAIKTSSKKIIVFMGAVLVVALIMGTIMYTVERKNETFENIPSSIYWAIVTITTVGYGDIVPSTGLGKFLSTLSMLIGYSILAVPTGIVSAEIVSQSKRKKQTSCSKCFSKNDINANYCSRCGHSLNKIN